MTKVAFTRITETGIRQYDENGDMIVDLSEPKPYKPTYDLEIGGRKAPFTAKIYFDIHTEIASFESKHILTAQLRAICTVLLHKHILRHFK